MSANLTHRINDLEKLLNVSYLREVIVPEIERMVKESNIDGLYDDARQFLNTTFLIENVIPEIEKVLIALRSLGLHANRNAQVFTDMQTSCTKVFVKSISGCVRTACSQLL